MEISPEYLLEGLMMKLKLQYFGQLMHRTDYWKRPWCWNRLKAGEEGHDRGWDGWMASPTQWTWVWVISGSWWWTGKPGVLQSIGSQEPDTTEQLNWTDKFLTDLLVDCKYSCTYLKASDVHILYPSISDLLMAFAPALNCSLSHIISVHLCIIFNLFSFTSSLLSW